MCFPCNRIKERKLCLTQLAQRSNLSNNLARVRATCMHHGPMVTLAVVRHNARSLASLILSVPGVRPETCQKPDQTYIPRHFSVVFKYLLSSIIIWKVIMSTHIHSAKSDEPEPTLKVIGLGLGRTGVSCLVPTY